MVRMRNRREGVAEAGSPNVTSVCSVVETDSPGPGRKPPMTIPLDSAEYLLLYSAFRMSQERIPSEMTDMTKIPHLFVLFRQGVPGPQSAEYRVRMGLFVAEAVLTERLLVVHLVGIKRGGRSARRGKSDE